MKSQPLEGTATASVDETSLHNDETSKLKTDIPLVVVIALLWTQLYYTSFSVWLHGSYYAYAWFVPPLAAYFFFRRWQEQSPSEGSRKKGLDLWLIATALLPVLVVIRVLEKVDASWRPPILLHALLAVLITHWLVWRFKGSKLSLSLIPTTIFGLSAIPYPFQIETAAIGALTTWVIEFAGIVFHTLGKAVLVQGGVIEYNGVKVEVTEGCSGIQSLQSLTMVALYLGEFFRLRIPSRFLLLGLGIAMALIVNVGRAIYLAYVRFEKGELAFEAAHDPVGHVAFAIGGLLLLFASWIMMGSVNKKKKTVKRTQVSTV